MANAASLPADMSFSAPPTEASSNPSSLSSTPPTTAADSISLASEPASRMESESTPIEDAIVALPLPPPAKPKSESTPDPTTSETATPGRARRARVSTPVYNLAKLSGTDIHGKRRANGDIVSNRRRRSRNISGATVVDSPVDPASAGASRTDPDKTEASGRQISVSAHSTPLLQRSLAKKAKTTPKAGPSTAQRVATRQTGQQPHTLTTKFSSLGKRGRKTFEKGIHRMSRELRRLQDTNEFAHIDERPVLYTVWRNGKYFDPAEAEAAAERERERQQQQQQEQEQEQERPRKKVKMGKGAADVPVLAKELKAVKAVKAIKDDKDDKPVLGSSKSRVKKNWLSKGLYAGQAAPEDPTKGLTKTEKQTLAQLPELSAPSANSKTLPFPMYNGLRELIQGRDFKLPWDVCHPMGRAQPKPDEWKKLTRSTRSDRPWSRVMLTWRQIAS